MVAKHDGARGNGEAAGGADIKAMSAATYAATADNFDAPALSFWLRQHEVRELDVNVIYARARKPGGD